MGFRFESDAEIASAIVQSVEHAIGQRPRSIPQRLPHRVAPGRSVRAGAGDALDRAMPGKVFKRSARDQGQSAIQSARQRAQTLSQPGWYDDFIRRRRDVDQSAIEIEKQRKNALFHQPRERRRRGKFECTVHPPRVLIERTRASNPNTIACAHKSGSRCG